MNSWEERHPTSSFYRRSVESIKRGQWSEDMFRSAASIINHSKHPKTQKPEWLTWIDPPTTEEDLKRGTDGWARTDRGDIPIQVKSSRGRADEHQRNFPDWNGLLFVLSDQEVSEEDAAIDLLYGIRLCWERLPER